LILVDTSVWVDHLRRGDAELAGLLERGVVVMHPFVVGEIACGSLADRLSILEGVTSVSVQIVAVASSGKPGSALPTRRQTCLS
jgi:predicted nucleic acid-binding protein